jgi:pimeloyl-ACP methyl ester carboxylesterase
MADLIRPFRVHVPDSDLADLRQRLSATRHVIQGPELGWDAGVPTSYLRELVDYWRMEFDWRAVEDRINTFANFRVETGGTGLHCVRLRGSGPRPIPIVLVHGWPGSFVEMIDLATLLATPKVDGGDEADSFDVVIPSLTGFGYSDAAGTSPWGSPQEAAAIGGLMDALGYERFGIHTYDIGASIMTALCLADPRRIIGYHTTEPGIPGPHPGPGLASMTREERAYRDVLRAWEADEGGYFALLRTRPRTLGHALNDSPAGLAAWLVEKWWAWTVPPGSGKSLHEFLSMDQVLANIALYWHTQTIDSANMTYYGPRRRRVPGEQVQVPVGVALTAQPIERAPRATAERFFRDIRRWVDLGQAGHFVTMERPGLLATAIRDFFRPLRTESSSRHE